MPATSANLGPGFDAFGLALDLHDELELTLLQAPDADGKRLLEIEVDGEGADSVPRDASHLVVRALDATLARLGSSSAPSLRLRCWNRIPHGRGLGSSAAAIVAGVLLGRALVPAGSERLDQPAALALASELEGHPDNVAACLLGGFTIAWSEGRRVRAVRLEPAPGLVPVVLVPPTSLGTETARGLLPATVPHADAAHAAGRAGLLVAALTQRPDLLLAATEDRLHQPYRAVAMPATDLLLRRLRARDVPAVVSGAGPSLLALVDAASVEQLVEEAPEGWLPMALRPGTGAEVLSPPVPGHGGGASVPR